MRILLNRQVKKKKKNRRDNMSLYKGDNIYNIVIMHHKYVKKNINKL